MRLLKPETITVTPKLLTLQNNNIFEVKNDMAYKIIRCMLMHSNEMTFYTASSYYDMCDALRAVALSNLNK